MFAKNSKWFYLNLFVFVLDQTFNKYYQFFWCWHERKKKNLAKCYLDNFIIINRHENTITIVVEREFGYVIS